MTREYYDRGGFPSPETNLRPANRHSQDAYWLLRSQLTAALAKEWQTVCDSSPEIAAASENLQAFVGRHSSRAFRVFRPEDAVVSHDAASCLFFR